jgi:hypothetical protein
VDEVPDHNGAQWLIVRWCPAEPGGGDPQRAGWHVVQTCPCHFGERVTVAYPDRDWAAAVRELMLLTTAEAPR